MADKSREERIYALAMALNSSLPSETFLRGDGTFWAKQEGGQPWKLKNEELLKYLYDARLFSCKMISV